MPKLPQKGVRWKVSDIGAEVIDEPLRATMERGGFAMEGFTGGTVQEYQDWFMGAYGFDPIGAAAGIAGKEEGFRERDPETAAEFFEARPLSFTPDEGFGGVPTTERGIAAQDIMQQQWGRRQEQQERQQGMAMMNWLMGQATELSGAQFGRLAGVGMQQAQAQVGFQAPMIDYSGMLGVMGMEQMRAERQRAQQFDFMRDLLPSLITLGGAFGGGGG